MTAYDLEVARLALQAVSSLAAVVSLYAIFRGLRQMERGTTERAKREDARHAEAMEALRQQGGDLARRQQEPGGRRQGHGDRHRTDGAGADGTSADVT